MTKLTIKRQNRVRPNDRSAGQAMILTVIVISSTLLGVASVGGLLILHQIRNSGNFTNSAKAIFAADAGVEWWLHQYKKPGEATASSSVVFSNGSSFKVQELRPDKALVTGQAGNSKRAFLIEARPEATIPCNTTLDLMIVLDRSGSIDNNEREKIAASAKLFVEKINPSSSTAHIGRVSFAEDPSIDLHLTGDISAIRASIDNIVWTNGATNMAGGLELAHDELANRYLNPLSGELEYDDHDRIILVPGEWVEADDNLSPDYIVVISDGETNYPPPSPTYDAYLAAEAAKSDGIIIFVVGVGTNDSVSFYLQNAIATSPDHYYDAEEGLDELDQVLDDLLAC